ncbi:unnamed protein product [Paramecium pentaurelia]|uniref:Tetratricopeptide repeat protein n=1 Tax=Paramecium pentaurelia TaxID=43138 RepID=A0A8S1S041_9CILI|nr:unnamed protein product [Paramecium pentaurelia]
MLGSYQIKLSKNMDKLLMFFKDQVKDIIIYFVAKCDLIEGFLENAQKNLQKANEIDQNNLENKTIQVQLLKKKRKYDDCKNLIEELLNRQLKNKDKEILMRLKPQIYFKQDKFQEAMVYCQKYLENNQAHQDICYTFGQSLLENKIYLLSIHFFDKVINQESHHLDANSGRSQALQKFNEQNQIAQSQIIPKNHRVLKNKQLSTIRLAPILNAPILNAPIFDTNNFSRPKTSQIRQQHNQ